MCWCPGVLTALVRVKLRVAFGVKQQMTNITIHQQNQQFRLDETYDSAYLLKACSVFLCLLIETTESYGIEGSTSND